MYCTLASSSPVSLQSLSPELFSCCCVFLSPSYILLLSCYFFPMLLCTPASLAFLLPAHMFSLSPLLCCILNSVFLWTKLLFVSPRLRWWHMNPTMALLRWTSCGSWASRRTESLRRPTGIKLDYLQTWNIHSERTFSFNKITRHVAFLIVQGENCNCGILGIDYRVLCGPLLHCGQN